jgi:hypothetical protein
VFPCRWDRWDSEGKAKGKRQKRREESVERKALRGKFKAQSSALSLYFTFAFLIFNFFYG